MHTIALRLAVTVKVLATRVRAVANAAGATAVEYALMVGLIAALIVGAVALLGDQVGDFFDKTNDNIEAND
jgi:Flp pilus assembly pilin Flp